MEDSNSATDHLLSTEAQLAGIAGEGQKEGTRYATVTALIIVLGLFIVMALNPDEIEIGEPEDSAGASEEHALTRQARARPHHARNANLQTSCASTRLLTNAKQSVKAVLSQCDTARDVENTDAAIGPVCPVGCREAWEVYRKDPCSEYARLEAEPSEQRTLMRTELETMPICFYQECHKGKLKLSAAATINGVLNHCPTAPGNCSPSCKKSLLSWDRNPCAIPVLIAMQSIPAQAKRRFISTRLHAHNFCLAHRDLKSRKSRRLEGRLLHTAAPLLTNPDCKSAYAIDKAVIALQRVEADCWERKRSSLFAASPTIDAPTNCAQRCLASLEVLASTPCAFHGMIKAHAQGSVVLKMSNKQLLRLVAASIKVCRIQQNIDAGT